MNEQEKKKSLKRRLIMKILNLTQHRATSEQIEMGVVDPVEKDFEEVRNLLTFDEIPCQSEMDRRAYRLREIAFKNDVYAVMLGGAPWFMSTLELEFRNYKILYAFTKRDCMEENGAKKSVFKHLGFFEVEKKEYISFTDKEKSIMRNLIENRETEYPKEDITTSNIISWLYDRLVVRK